ncbi:TetR/AcrR family transcriptional regulator [Microlunatus speluncae]|uniref:TetR/AcrR family transcriptional regulator n=1 Tax=Microlunatus speluncae TaxID=2594267 RepID=UPI00126631A8|nr:TetR/AcrR family transcriptional regulator [Microlunatus speluncae]
MTVTNSQADQDPGRPKLRQQRKAATRARIAATAMELFLDRGFEHVSVAEIAASAGVTEKTVFNHFASKEDLAHPQGQDLEAEVLEALRRRPAGTSALATLRTFFLDGYAQRFPAEVEIRRRAARIAELVAGSPALRAREREILARFADRIGAQLAAEVGARPGDLRPTVVANAVIAVHQAVLAEYRAGLPGAESAAALSRRMLRAAAEAFDFLAAGLSTYATGDDPAVPKS